MPTQDSSSLTRSAQSPSGRQPSGPAQPTHAQTFEQSSRAQSANSPLSPNSKNHPTAPPTQNQPSAPSQPPQTPPPPQNRTQQLRSLFIGGLLPVLAFSVIEEWQGVLWGLVAGMVFGVGEILWEWFTLRRVDPMTWGGNGILLLLGGISLVTQEGIWFKLQPALMEVAFCLLLWGSLVWGKPLLLVLAQKQGGLPKDLEGIHPRVAEVMKRSLRGMTFRLGVFFAIQSGIAVWAAFAWSTAAWAALKGVGLTVSLIAYLVVESLVLRYRVGSSR